MKYNYILGDKIIFEPKSEAVPYNYRISYKMGQVSLIMDKCCRGGCSLIKLHMITTAMYSEKDKELLIRFLDEKILTYTTIRFDPSINRLVKFAIFDKIIIQQKNGLLKLTEKGKLLAKSINADKDLMKAEKVFLTRISTKLSEDSIKHLMKDWSSYDVKIK